MTPEGASGFSYLRCVKRSTAAFLNSDTFPRLEDWREWNDGNVDERGEHALWSNLRITLLNSYYGSKRDWTAVRGDVVRGLGCLYQRLEGRRAEGSLEVDEYAEFAGYVARSFCSCLDDGHPGEEREVPLEEEIRTAAPSIPGEAHLAEPEAELQEFLKFVADHLSGVNKRHWEELVAIYESPGEAIRVLFESGQYGTELVDPDSGHRQASTVADVLEVKCCGNAANRAAHDSRLRKMIRTILVRLEKDSTHG